MKNEGVIYIMSEPGKDGQGAGSQEAAGTDKANPSNEAKQADAPVEQKKGLAGAIRRGGRSFSRIFRKGNVSAGGEEPKEEEQVGAEPGVAGAESKGDGVKKQESGHKDIEDEGFIELTPELEDKLKKYDIELKGKKGKVNALDAVKSLIDGHRKMAKDNTLDPEFSKNLVIIFGVIEKNNETSEDKTEEGAALRNLILVDVFGRGDEQKGIEVYNSAVQQVKEKSTSAQGFISHLAKLTGKNVEDLAEAEALFNKFKLESGDSGIAAAPVATLDGAGGEGGGGGTTTEPGSDTPEPGGDTLSQKDKDRASRLQSIIDWLKNPSNYKKMGYRAGVIALFLAIIYIGIVYAEAEAVEKVTTGR